MRRRVFLSHAWRDADPDRTAARPQRGLARQLRDRLQAAGVEVFFDERSIQDFDRLDDAIVDGLRRSHLFVAWFSDLYPSRRGCAWELTTAMIATLDSPQPRLLTVNPEATTAHLDGLPLLDQRVASCPAADDEAAWDALVANVVARAGEVAEPFGDAIDLSETPWVPEPRRFGSTRFTGRFRELWALHGLLTRSDVTGQPGARGAAVIDAMGGAGKTLLLLEYAQRFAAAWPGGVVWLNGHGYDRDEAERDTADKRAAARAQELVAVATGLGVDNAEIAGQLGGLDAAGADALVRRLIGERLAGRGRLLWLVDDLPHGLTAAELEAWRAPATAGVEAVTVVTTRTTSYEGLLTPVRLDHLDPDDGYALLTRDHPPADPAQMQAARSLVERVGGHALAIDVTRAAIGGPSDYWPRWDALANAPDGVIGELEHLAAQIGVLAGDHTPYVLLTIQRSIDALAAEGRSVLAAAACFASLPIPLSVLIDHRVQAGADPTIARRGVEAGVRALVSASLARRTDRGALVVHRLVLDVARHLAAGATDAALEQQLHAVLGRELSAIHDASQHAALADHYTLARSLPISATSPVSGWVAWYER